jgi:hypothetical protein
MTRSVGCPNIHHINSNVRPIKMFNFTDSNVIKYSNNRFFQKLCSVTNVELWKDPNMQHGTRDGQIDKDGV